MEIKKSAVAGSVESSDILIAIEPTTTQTIELTLDSSVEKQFGKQIRAVILETLNHLGAVHRAAEQEQYAWKEIDTWNV